MYYNFMMNFDGDISNENINCFIKSLVDEDTHSVVVVVDGDILIKNKPEAEFADFYWSINRSLDDGELFVFSDMTISSDLNCDDDILQFIHNVSIFFKLKIYTDADISYIPEKYYAVWCVDGTKRRIFFDDGNGNFIDHFNINI